MRNAFTEKMTVTRRSLLSLAAAGTMGCVTFGPTIGGCSSATRKSRPTSEASNAARNRPRLGLDTYTLHRCLTAKDPVNRRDLW